MKLLKILGILKDTIGIIFWLPVLLLILVVYFIHDFLWWNGNNKMDEENLDPELDPEDIDDLDEENEDDEDIDNPDEKL